MKIQKLFKVENISKINSTSFGEAEFAHFELTDKNKDIPSINSFMAILPLGTVKVGQEFLLSLSEVITDH